MPGAKRVYLENSKRIHPPGSRLLKAPPDHGEVIQATVVLRPASSEKERLRAIRALAQGPPGRRTHLDADAFQRAHGARPRDIARVVEFARKHRLNVVEADSAKRSVVLSGTVADFGKAFGVKFTAHSLNQRTYRSFHEKISIPDALAGAVVAVLGLDNRPCMEHHVFCKMHAAAQASAVDPKTAARKYEFPLKAGGKNQCVAIVMLGGGFHDSDIAKYFQRLGLKKPDITVVGIAGAANNPAPPKDIKAALDFMGAKPVQGASVKGLSKDDQIRAFWTIEATLDIQLIGSFANDARIVVYFAPNENHYEFQALTTALHSKQHPPDVISCSWGSVEDNVPPDFAHSLDQLFQDAALKGVTICFSSGDRGADTDPKTGSPRVHFPASSPHVLACGGTHWMEPSGSLIEHAWNEKLSKSKSAASGGGVSKLFALPVWQKDADVEKKTGKQGRGVPDVSGKADIASGYKMLVGGYTVGMGGTSAAAPMWAGLIARLNQQLGKNVGYLTPLLYQSHFKKGMRDITKGTNGRYSAGPGWDACTGLGTPRGRKLLAALKTVLKK